MKQQEYPQGEADANGFTYQYLKESDTYRLTKGTDTENVIIPYEYNGKVVSEVGERAFYGCINIKTVKAEEGADRRKNHIRIDKSAFENCENLRKSFLFDQGSEAGKQGIFIIVRSCGSIQVFPTMILLTQK